MHSDCLCCFSRQILPHAEIDAGAGGRLQNLLDLDIRGLHEHSPFCFINTKTFSISPKSCSSVSVSTMQQTNINKTFLACFSCFSFRFFFLGSCEVMILQKHGKTRWKASSVMSSVSQALDKTGASGLARLVGNETAVDEKNATLEIPNLDFPSFLGKPAIRPGKSSVIRPRFVGPRWGVSSRGETIEEVNISLPSWGVGSDVRVILLSKIVRF